MAEQSFSLLNQTVSVIMSNYHSLVAQALSCDIIVIPFQEQDTALSNETKPQSIISCPFLLLPQWGNTALMWASRNGYDDVVEKLLAADANHDHQDEVRNFVTRVMLIHVLIASVSNKVLHLFLGQ